MGAKSKGKALEQGVSQLPKRTLMSFQEFAQEMLKGIRFVTTSEANKSNQLETIGFQSNVFEKLGSDQNK